jgi:hypothetical protein
MIITHDIDVMGLPPPEIGNIEAVYVQLNLV